MKKWLAILGMITCLIGLTACGSSEAVPSDYPVSESAAIETGMYTVDNIWQIVNAGLEENVDNEVIYNGLIGFKSSLEEMGNYIGTDGATVEYKDDEIIVNVNVLGEKRDAVVEVIINKDGTEYIGITTNVQYTMAEKMQKAALNTLLGMGTVFVILILISLIISLFGLIPKLFDKKKAPEPVKAENTNKVVEQIAEAEELNDDLELVAVISAAVAAYEGSGSTDGFVVRSIRKAHKK